MKPRSIVVLTVIAIIISPLLTACGDKETSLGPPKINYGEDISEMGMFVVDPRYTVAALPKESEDWMLFDDIGEFFKYRDANPDAGLQAMWVNDYQDEDSIKAEDAWYVKSAEIKSPMGWGIAAFRDETDADAAAAELGGVVMSWDDVQARQWAGPPAPMEMDGSPLAASPVASPDSAQSSP